jgi:hypothetical protein
MARRGSRRNDRTNDHKSFSFRRDGRASGVYFGSNWADRQSRSKAHFFLMRLLAEAVCYSGFGQLG